MSLNYPPAVGMPTAPARTPPQPTRRPGGCWTRPSPRPRHAPGGTGTHQNGSGSPPSATPHATWSPPSGRQPATTGPRSGRTSASAASLAR